MFTSLSIRFTLYPEIKKKHAYTHIHTQRKRLHEGGSSPRLKPDRNSLVDGPKETNCSIPSEIVYRRLYRGRQLNRNFIFHSNIVTINRRDSRNCRDKQFNPLSAINARNLEDGTRLFLSSKKFRRIVRSNQSVQFLRNISSIIYLGYACRLALEKKDPSPSPKARREDSKGTKGPI